MASEAKGVLCRFNATVVCIYQYATVLYICVLSVCVLYTVSAQIVEDNSIVLTIPLNVSHFKALNTLEVSVVFIPSRHQHAYIRTYVRMSYNYIDSLDSSAHLALMH